MSNTSHIDKLQAEWLERLDQLVKSVEAWASELGWVTKRIKVSRIDSEIGTYQAPALIMQDTQDGTRVLLDPVARRTPGAEGVVDLYLMPGYDDIASLYFCDGQWQIHYMYSGTATVATIREAPSTLLSKASFEKVLVEMKNNAV